MLSSSTRLLRLLSLLQTRSHWMGPELAERLEVHPRTLRRDIDRLRQLGYPVHASSGVAGVTPFAQGKRCRRCCWTMTRLWPCRLRCAPPPPVRWGH